MYFSAAYCRAEWLNTVWLSLHHLSLIVLLQLVFSPIWELNPSIALQFTFVWLLMSNASWVTVLSLFTNCFMHTWCLFYMNPVRKSYIMSVNAGDCCHYSAGSWISSEWLCLWPLIKHWKCRSVFICFDSDTLSSKKKSPIKSLFDGKNKQEPDAVFKIKKMISEHVLRKNSVDNLLSNEMIEGVSARQRQSQCVCWLCVCWFESIGADACCEQQSSLEVHICQHSSIGQLNKQKLLKSRRN